ncbi:MAG: JmjC domain-containing protein [Myxococcota bacterium]
MSYFDWRTLDHVLRCGVESSQSDVLVVRQGRLVPALPPRSLRDARLFLDTGASLVVRRAERRNNRLRELAASFADEIPGAAQVQLFITPKGARGFGWHYDAEDVFILQTMGSKNYFFRENTVNPRPSPQPVYDFSAVRRELTPIMTCTLLAGDWLYVPSGWWHVATAQEDSLSISVGLLPRE